MAWIGQKRLDSRTNDVQFGSKTGHARLQCMPDQPQIGAERAANMIPLRPCAPHHTALDPTKLLNITMIGLNGSNLTGRGRPALHGHQQIACGPVLRVTVWGVDPEDQDKARAFEMHPRATVLDSAVGQPTIAASIRSNQAIGL